MKNKVFGVIGAMESEVAQLHAALGNMETAEHSGLTFYSGTMGENRVVLVKCGIGKVNAARCTQILIDKYAPDYIVNTGIAGGIGEGLAVADVVIGAELVQHDFDAVAFGYARGNICDPTHRDTPSVFCSDKALIEAFCAAAASVIDAKRVKAGRIATGDCFVCDSETKRRIRAEFDARVTPKDLEETYFPAFEALVREADKAMYAAKSQWYIRNGRDRRRNRGS